MIISQISHTNANTKSHLNLPCKKVNGAQIPYEQNGLSFAQAQALKSSRLLSQTAFAGRIIAPSYDVADVKIVQELLEKCRYGKKDLIYGDISQVRTKITDEGVEIENFYTADNSPDGNIYGICEELAYKVGRRLQKAFGDKYLVFGVHGGNKEFPKAHMYLGMLHNTAENEELIRTQTENFTQLHKLCKEFSISEVYKSFPKDPNEAAKLKGTDLYEQYMIAAEKFCKENDGLTSNFDRKSFANSLIIDPSFARVEEFGAGNVFEGYTCCTVRSLEQINAVPSHTGVMDKTLSLGYLKDLVPEIANGRNASSMVGVFACDTGIYPIGCKEFNSAFPKVDRTYPLYKFMIKLNEAFKTGTDNAVEAG